MENKRLVELHHENVESEFLVGDIYLGKVKKLLPGLNAAFIDIGHEKDAFLHYLDLGPNIPTQQKFFFNILNRRNSSSLQQFSFEPEIQKTGKISEVLKAGQYVVVQIVKEPISTKGPRLSTQLSIAGRYLILMPFSNSISISKKIGSAEERERLKRLLTSIKPNNFGLIVRTVAEGKLVAELDKDMRNLIQKWNLMIKNLNLRKPRLLGEMDKAETIVRDILNESFNRILVDNEQYYVQIKDYIQNIAPHKENIVKLYTGDSPVFQNVGIDRQLKTLFGKIVNLSGGAYLIIEHTEAMHVIDVNSGSRRSIEQNQEANAYRINLEAAEEIARQLRLRDLGGIVIIDFIDMKSGENRRKIAEQLKEFMKEDRAKHTILPVSKFGLVQITRQRVRPQLDIGTKEECPLCKGTGEASSKITIVEELETRLSDFVKNTEKSITIVVNPLVHASLVTGIYSVRLKWFFKYKRWVKIIPDDSLFLTQYKFPHLSDSDSETQN
jgi:ribonuclease G